MNSNILKKTYAHKDERVKTCTQIIEGIKFIKFYSWELAFDEMVKKIRKL